MKTQIIGNMSVYKDVSTGIWIVRNRNTGKEMAHESNKKAALVVAKCMAEK